MGLRAGAAVKIAAPEIPFSVVVLVAGLGVLAIVLYKAVPKLADAAAGAANAVNPLNHDNVFAGGVNNVGAAVSGDPGWTLGGWVYDVTHANPNTSPTWDGAKDPETIRLMKRYPAPQDAAWNTQDTSLLGLPI
jgi:hypothetical protein